MTEVSGDADQGAVRGHFAKRLRVLLLAILLAISVDAVLCGLFGLAEWLWQPELNPWNHHLIGATRGVLASCMVAAVLAWWFLKGSPPLLPVGAWTTDPAMRAQQRTDFAKWLVSMRWAAVVVVAVVTFTMVHLVGLLGSQTWWPLVLLTLLLAATNVLYSVLLRCGARGQWLIPLQIYVDLAIFAAMLHFSAGVQNPLALLMIIHVVLSGLMLSRRQCYAIATVGSVLFAMVAIAEWLHVVPHYPLLITSNDYASITPVMSVAAFQPVFVLTRVALEAALLLLTAYFSTHFAERLRRDERRLDAMAHRIADERQLLIQALESTETAMRVVGSDRQCLWASTQWVKWFGGAQGASASQKCVQCMTRTEEGSGLGRCDDASCLLEMTQQDGTARTKKLQLKLNGRYNDEQRILQMITAPLPAGNGQPRQVVELVRDITQQQNAQDHLVQTSKLAAIGEMAGNIAHEVNNPVSIISAKARLLLSQQTSQLSGKVERELHKIVDLSDRAARIARSVLSYCRPSGARRSLLDMRTPILKALAPLEQKLHERQVRVVEQLDQPLIVEANIDEMVQVFFNLFLNALDAMPDGGTLFLKGCMERHGDTSYASIQVRDTGSGIDPSITDRVFEPFFTTKGDRKGTGLGLSVCQGLVRSHGGTIDVRSRPGIGARFHIRLPAKMLSKEETTLCLERAS